MKLKWIHNVLILSAVIHLIVIVTAKIQVMDEIYYVPDSIKLLQGIPSNFEHPPLVKILMAMSIELLGNNIIAWRLPALISAIIATYLTYLIAKKYVSERMATYAATLLTCSTIFLLVGSTGILDMPMIVLSLAGIYAYMNRKTIQSGVWFGLAVLAKETALLMGLAVFVYAWVRRDSKKRILLLVTIFLIVSIGGLWIYDTAFPETVTVYNVNNQQVAPPITINNPISHMYAIYVYQKTLVPEKDPNNTFYYPPISWVTPFGNNAFKPWSWYWAANYIGNTTALGTKTVNWQAQPNPFTEYTMFPLLFALPIFAYKKHDNQISLLWLWLLSSYIPWLVVGFFFRMAGNFYLDSAIPALAIGTTYCLSQIQNRKLKWTISILFLTGAIIFFLYWFPINFVGR